MGLIGTSNSVHLYLIRGLLVLEMVFNTSFCIIWCRRLKTMFELTLINRSLLSKVRAYNYVALPDTTSV